MTITIETVVVLQGFCLMGLSILVLFLARTVNNIKNGNRLAWLAQVRINHLLNHRDDLCGPKKKPSSERTAKR